MRYRNGEAFRNSNLKSLALVGMSGVGKTVLANKLKDQFGWLNYSVDNRIGAHYLQSEILKDAKTQDERQVISALLQSESLRPLSNFLGKPGNPDLGGIPFNEYLRRQRLHREAEISSLLDAPALFDAQLKQSGYRYNKFICDTGGSLCEVVDGNDPKDPVLGRLADRTLIVYIRASDKHENALLQRFDKDPKPMYYNEKFLTEIWANYKKIYSLGENQIDPDRFIRWGFNKLLQHRKPKYESIAENWGVVLEATDAESVRHENDLIDLVSDALDEKDHELKGAPGSFGKVVLSQRELKNLSRSALSRKLDISNAKLKRIETGRQEPSEELEDLLFEVLFLDPVRRELSQKNKSVKLSAWLKSVHGHVH